MSRPSDFQSDIYVHATALVVAERGVLIRGASGAGKSRLAATLLLGAHQRGVFARLVGDDRVALSVHHERLVARGHPVVAGLIEQRTQGIVPLQFERACVVACVVELASDPLPRYPAEGSGEVEVLGLYVPCLQLSAEAVAFDRFGVVDRLLRKLRLNTL